MQYNFFQLRYRGAAAQNASAPQERMSVIRASVEGGGGGASNVGRFGVKDNNVTN